MLMSILTLIRKTAITKRPAVQIMNPDKIHETQFLAND